MFVCLQRHRNWSSKARDKLQNSETRFQFEAKRITGLGVF